MKNLGYIAIAFIMVACGGNSFQTESGTEVTYLKKGDGEMPVDTMISLVRIKCVTEDGKVIIPGDQPSPVKLDPNNVINQGELFVILTQLRTGDSVGFDLVASELFEKTFRAPLPDSIDGNSLISFQVAYLDQLTEQGYYDMAAKKAAQAAEKQLVIDAQILDEYMSENEIEATTTESGLRYVITEQGSGPKPEDGQVVQVNYAGRILDGALFDTSIETIARENGVYNENRPGGYVPLTFPIGQGRVIQGWDEGIGLLNVGSKATLYIPSSLGYGNRGSGPIIKPNSILVFDVELVGIE